MKDIFSDLYDRVLSFFTSQAQDESKSIAKNRLKTVLMQDRVGFSERAMQMLKDDLIETISTYLEIDDQCFNLSIDAGNNTTILNLSIPVIRPKTDEEIDEALAIAEKEKLEKTQEIVDELQELVKEKAQELAVQISENDKENEEIEEDSEDENEDKKEEATTNTVSSNTKKESKTEKSKVKE